MLKTMYQSLGKERSENQETCTGRIDRYYSSEESFESDNEAVDAISGLGETLSVMDDMEKANENPEVCLPAHYVPAL